MWSVFLLTLFLALGLQPALSVPIQRSLAVEEEYLERGVTEEDRKIKLAWLQNNWKKIAEVLGDMGGLVPADFGKVSGVGILVQALLKFPKLISVLIPEADKLDGIRSEMNAINTRLDYITEDLKWAYNDYQTAIDNIRNAWLKYKDMEDDEDMLKDIFVPFYTPLVDSALVIHRLLTSDPVALTRSSSTQTLGDVLAKRFRCHEKEVEEYFLYLIDVLVVGNWMDEKYYELKNIKYGEFRKKISNTIESESADVLRKTQQRCISNSELHIKRDIIERIDDTKVHQQIANNIGDFLKTTYGRYDWMVVAFTTHNSKDLFNFLRRHVLYGFTEINRGTVTVAVAHQIKGRYTKAEKVKEKLQDCLEGVYCNNIGKEIDKCIGTELYTAIHVFKYNAQTYISAYADEDENVDDANSGSFAGVDGTEASIYRGKCSFGKGKTVAKATETIDPANAFHSDFFVLLKSDEEMGEDPCKDYQCENGGKCETVPDTKIAMCDSNYPCADKKCTIKKFFDEKKNTIKSWFKKQKPGKPSKS